MKKDYDDTLTEEHDDSSFNDENVSTVGHQDHTSASEVSDFSPDPSSPRNTLRRRRSIPRPPLSDSEVSDGKSSLTHERSETRDNLEENEINLVNAESTQTSQDRVATEASGPFESVESNDPVESEKKHEEDSDKVSGDLKENDTVLEETESSRTIPGAGCSMVADSVSSNDDQRDYSFDSASQLGGSTSPSVLLILAGFVIKAIWFQFRLLYKFVFVPISTVYSMYVLVIDPFGSIRRFIMRRLFSVLHSAGLLVSDRLKEHRTMWRLLLRFGCGSFWIIYLGLVLSGLLCSSLMSAGFLMKYLVEEPMQIKEELSFDYTESNPVAFIPVMSCDAAGCGAVCKQKSGVTKSSGSRFVPVNHKLQPKVLLTLPETTYNRNLGVFQVRVDFLSADGNILASKWQHSLLTFKSEPIRLLSILLKFAPIVTGHVSESQNVELKIQSFTEGEVPTSCIKVIIESRAEHSAGAGIPELYDASLILESELSFIKHVMWQWKKTVYIWISMTIFAAELLLTLISCRCIIFSRSKLRRASSTNEL